MRQSLERLGWGAGPLDRSPPIGPGAGEVLRALALWSFLAACSQRTLGLAVHGVFTRPHAPLSGAPGTLVRLLSLLERLMTVELPILTRVVRVETTGADEWMRAPQGGRVDVASSLRASGGTTPETWLVRRTERRVDTPVNVFVAAVLRAAAARVDRVLALYRQRRLVAPELVGSAAVGFQRFFRDHFLGRIAVPPGASPEAYRGAAARRASEMSRIRSLVAWWDAVQAAELSALQDALAGGGTELAEVDVHAAYEMAVALGLVCALASVLRCEGGDEATGLLFVGRSARATLHLGPADPTGLEGRGLTATLVLADAAGASVTWYIEARNCRASEAKKEVTHLAFACHDSPGRCMGLLLTPGPIGTLPPRYPVRWAQMPLVTDVPALVGRWREILASTLEPRLERP